MMILSTAILSAGERWDRYGRHHDGPHWFGVLAFVLILGAIVFFVNRRRHRWAAAGGMHGMHGHSSARGVLAERYARGEIDADEYRQRRDVLDERPPKKP